MKRHLATRESIAKLQAARKKREAEKPPSTEGRNGLTRQQIREALMSISKSGYKIPAKLMPKAPS